MHGVHVPENPDFFPKDDVIEKITAFFKNPDFFPRDDVIEKITAFFSKVRTFLMLIIIITIT